MAANGFLNTTQLDLSAYKESLKQYLRQQDQFKDYDYEGSNLSVLLDILAYNTYHNALYLNMVGSEMFLDTAQLRESVVSHAKELNYVPRSRTSARITLDVTVNVPAATEIFTPPDSVTIPKYFKISGKDINNNTSYYFVTEEPIILSRASGYSAQVQFFEGIVLTEAFNYNSRIIASSEDADTDSITVLVRDSAISTNSTTWSRADSLFGLSATDTIYFVQGAQDYKYEIVFGNNVVGKSLTPGNIVYLQYRKTVGEDANGINRFASVDSVEGYSVSLSLINNTDKTDGGSYQETTESIRFNSTKYFQTQERAITSGDFVSLIKTNFPSLRTVIAYGGEEATPPRFGKVLISAVPFDGVILSDPLKLAIQEFARNRTTLSIDPLVVDPDFIFVDVQSVVKYNNTKTNKTANELRTIVNQAIHDYTDLNLADFGSDLRFSKLTNAIDLSDASIVSNETNLRLSKRITPQPAVPFTTTWNFENALLTDYIGRAYVNETPVITSSQFLYRGFNASIEDDGNGTLLLKTDELDDVNVGTVDYTVGIVNITSLTVDSYPGNSIKIYALLQNQDVETATNKVIIIDQEDISIQVNAVRA
jgi:hypothetical protein